jgi:hypothetical protein
MCWIWMFSNEPNDESNTKRRKTENFAVDISNGPVTQEKRDDSPAITNVEPALNQETSPSDELLELLAFCCKFFTNSGMRDVLR